MLESERSAHQNLQNDIEIMKIDQVYSAIYTYIHNPISAGRNLAHKKKTNQWALKYLLVKKLKEKDLSAS